MAKQKALALILAAALLLTGLTGCKKKQIGEYEPESATARTAAQEEYTYDLAWTAFPNHWSPTSVQTAAEKEALSFITSALYEFDYTDTGSYTLVPVMAASMPVDVTEKYVGEEWGIREGETGRAFRIALNTSACWEDKTPITADTYLYSLKTLLDPHYDFYQAASVYTDALQIHNARAYQLSGTRGCVPNAADGSQLTYPRQTWTADADGYYRTPDGKYLFFALYDDLEWLGGSCIREYYNYGYFADCYPALLALADEKGYVPVTDETAGMLLSFISTPEWGGETLDQLAYYTVYGEKLDTVEFSQVGLQRVDAYTIDVIVDKPLSGFFVPNSLKLPLLHESLFEACRSRDEKGRWLSSYGTSVETTISCGPYILKAIHEDEDMVWERNENWFGYQEAFADTYGDFVRTVDGVTCPQYMTDRIRAVAVSEIGGREALFLKGELDQLGLNSELIKTYSGSRALYYTPGASTYYGILNSDYDALLAAENVLNGGTADTAPAACPTPYQYNKTILAIPEFRQALCYALDRAQLCRQLYPAGAPAFGLYSDGIIADPEEGTPFNQLQTAKAGICEYWGVSWGEDGEYADVDAAYDAITGFDLTQARQLVDEAVQTAVSRGWMTDQSIVCLNYCAASASTTENKWFSFFADCFEDLMEGTALEGRFRYEADFTLGSDFTEKLQNGQCDTAWGFGWSSEALDPYDLFQVYVDGAAADAADAQPYQYDLWIDYGAVDVTMTLDAGDGPRQFTHSVYDWWQILNGEDLYETGLPDWSQGKMDDGVRAEVLARLQTRVLLNYTTIPLMNEGSAQLKGGQVQYGRENYVYGIGRGGLRYLTYAYTDEEWQNYCADQPEGRLTY